MSDNKKKSYKEKNGTTRVGDFLRSINFSKVTEVVTSVLKGDISSAIDVISNSKELSEEQVKMALKELEHDVIEMQEITKRWESDNLSDSWWSKNVRPLSLMFLTVTMFLYIILDSSIEGFSVDKEWIDLLSSLLLLIYSAYYGGRSLEKIQNIKKKK
jgi:hypothetical protein